MAGLKARQFPDKKGNNVTLKTALGVGRFSGEFFFQIFDTKGNKIMALGSYREQGKLVVERLGSTLFSDETLADIETWLREYKATYYSTRRFPKR